MVSKIYIATTGENNIFGNVYVAMVVVDDSFFRKGIIKKNQEFLSTYQHVDKAYVDVIEASKIDDEHFSSLISESIVNCLNTVSKFWNFPIFVYSSISKEFLTPLPFSDKLYNSFFKQLDIIFTTNSLRNKGIFLANKYAEFYANRELQLLQGMYPEITNLTDINQDNQTFIQKNSHLIFIKKRYLK